MDIKVCQFCLKVVDREIGGTCPHCNQEGHIVSTRLDIPRDYSLIHCKNSSVLAKANKGISNFVTWSICSDIDGATGVTWGHYFDDIFEAMEDYEKRSVS